MVFLFNCLLMLAAPSGAATLEGLKADDVAAVRVPGPGMTVPHPKAADGMLDPLSLMALTGPKLLFTQMADTPAKFDQFKAVWQPVIKKAGLKALLPEYSPGFGALKYETTGGLAIRSFLCDTAHMPLSAAEIELSLTSALNREGLRVLGVYGVPVDGDTFPEPTLNFYYVTRYDKNPSHERQLRYLGFRDEAIKLDAAVLERAGLKVIADQGGALFYIGSRAGVMLAASNDEATTAKQAEYYKDLVKKRGETLLEIKTDRLAKPIVSEGAEYSYLTKVYYLW